MNNLKCLSDNIYLITSLCKNNLLEIIHWIRIIGLCALNKAIELYCFGINHWIMRFGCKLMNTCYPIHIITINNKLIINLTIRIN
jgi:hypothetical protein